MLLSFDRLSNHLAQTLLPFYVISSDEHLLAQQAVDKIRVAARNKGFTERKILSVERSFKWGELFFASQSLSLFSDKKIIELRIPNGKVGGEGAKALQIYAKSMHASESNDQITIITLPKLDWATQKSAWVNTLQKEAVYIDIPVVERTQLPAWIKRTLQEEGLRASEESVSLIANRVEGNLLAAYQEIQKMAMLYPAGEVTFDQVKASIAQVARYDVFQLGPAWLLRDTATLIRMLEGLQGEGEAMPLILWVLTEECRTLLKLKSGLNRGETWGVLCKQHKIWGPRERLMKQAATKWHIESLHQALQSAALLDQTIKGLSVPNLSEDSWHNLVQWAVQLPPIHTSHGIVQ